ncbi:MAG: ABC transporter ATP-binding protein [Methylomicrobium sp.]|nr:ABC transporter ATP-binding protein [Methylomicrobium sp.]
MSNSDDVLIKVENVSKKFCRSLKRSMLYGIEDISRDLLHLPNTSDKLRGDEFWAVDDVSFEVKRGECLGIIGRNGAGKSTLLKMLNGIILPDKGKITIKGKVGALIEVGAGFHPMLTGRENIYVNGAILGMSKREIDKKFDEIVAFAELEEFIDMPVKHYSSGMYVRLGFAIAVQMEPDVLILDEVLAVGDVGFRTKCYNAIANLLPKSAVLFVSHSMQQITRISDQSLLLDQGQVKYYGNPTIASIEYDKIYLTKNTDDIRTGTQEAEITSFEYLDEFNNKTKEFTYGKLIHINLKLIGRTIDDLVLIVEFRKADGEVVAECNSHLNEAKILVKDEKFINVDIVIENININPGAYNIGLILISKKYNKHYDWIRFAGIITIKGNQIGCATQQLTSHWKVTSVNKKYSTNSHREK